MAVSAEGRPLVTNDDPDHAVERRVDRQGAAVTPRDLAHEAVASAETHQHFLPRLGATDAEAEVGTEVANHVSLLVPGVDHDQHDLPGMAPGAAPAKTDLALTLVDLAQDHDNAVAAAEAAAADDEIMLFRAPLPPSHLDVPSPVRTRRAVAVRIPAKEPSPFLVLTTLWANPTALPIATTATTLTLRVRLERKLLNVSRRFVKLQRRQPPDQVATPTSQPLVSLVYVRSLHSTHHSPSHHDLELLSAVILPTDALQRTPTPTRAQRVM